MTKVLPITTQEAAAILVADIDKHREHFQMNDWAFFDAYKAEGVIPDGMIITLENIDAPNTQCGSTLCIAGFATMEYGYNQKFIVDDDGYGEFVWIFKGDDEEYDPDFHAIGRKYLHLTEHQASMLFDGDNTNDEAYDYLTRLAEGEDPEEVLGYDVTGEIGHCSCDECN